MSGPTHGGKGDDRRPEGKRGAYASGYDAIDWNARDADVARALDSVSMDVPAVPEGEGGA